jgi:multimeric flavodoxin WrbA
MERIKLLGIIGSPRTNSNSKIMMKEALKGFKSIFVPDTTIIELSKKTISHCTGCNQCRKKKRCIYNDDFNEILNDWIEADALIYSCPVYHMSVPSKLKALIDKLGHVNFSKYKRTLPRFCKVGAVLAQGTSKYGGQELTIQFLTNHLLIMNCIPISGDTPGSYLGGPGQSPNWVKGSIKSDDLSLKVARNLGKRLAEMTIVVKNGLIHSRAFLSDGYILSD